MTQQWGSVNAEIKSSPLTVHINVPSVTFSLIVFPVVSSIKWSMSATLNETCDLNTQSVLVNVIWWGGMVQLRPVPKCDGLVCLLPFQYTATSLLEIWLLSAIPQWGAADAEIKVPSGESTELKRSPFNAWSRSVYSHTCYGYCQGFLPCLFLPFWSIHLHFFQNLSRFLLCWLWLTHDSCVGPQNKIGHPAGCRFPCWVPAENK